jgi:cytochrome c oxidase assembly protein subunit 15
MATQAKRLLPHLALLTLVLLYLVVLAGSVVRATGSGMGCPDWPRCYGKLIPPTRAQDIDVSKLDLDRYRRSWASHGREGVEVTEESIRRNFSAMETWIEFINRCLGAVSGLAALATFLCALASSRGDWLLRGLLLAELVLFGVVAWLGKVVVDTNLLPWKITLHMMLAMGLITMALAVLHRVRPGSALPLTLSMRRHLAACLLAVLVQTVVGTQVRELVDEKSLASCCGDRLEQHLGASLIWHRVGAITTLTLVTIAFFRLRFGAGQGGRSAPLLTNALGLLVALEYGVGVLLIRAGLPAALQPVHLALAFVLHGLLFALLLRSRLQPDNSSANLTS